MNDKEEGTGRSVVVVVVVVVIVIVMVVVGVWLGYAGGSVVKMGMINAEGIQYM